MGELSRTQGLSRVRCEGSETVVGEIGQFRLVYDDSDPGGDRVLRVYSGDEMVFDVTRPEQLGPQVNASWYPKKGMRRRTFLTTLVHDVIALRDDPHNPHRATFRPDLHMFWYEQPKGGPARGGTPRFNIDAVASDPDIVAAHPSFSRFYELGASATCFDARYTDAGAYLIPGWPPSRPWTTKRGLVMVKCMDSFAGWIPYFAAHTSGYENLELLRGEIGKLLPR